MHSLNAANPAVDLAPFGRWTLRDESAQRRSPPRYAYQNPTRGGIVGLMKTIFYE